VNAQDIFSKHVCFYYGKVVYRNGTREPSTPIANRIVKFTLMHSGMCKVVIVYRCGFVGA
jgi:hypothetical protein